jgi:hypothetical protein
MTLLSPIWLFLLIPLGLSLWLWKPPTRLLFAVRALSVLLVVLALAGLAIRLPSRAGTVIVVSDRSLSMPEGSDAAAREAVGLIYQHMGGDDSLGVVAFGQQVAVEHAPSNKPFKEFASQVGGNASSIGEAIETAMALVPKDTPGRLLVLSDGKWTGRDPTLLVPTALARNIAIDYRALERPTAGDLAVARVDVPSLVSTGESFLLTGWVHSPTAQEISYVLKKGDAVLAQGTRKVIAGTTRLTFRDRATLAGNQEYILTVSGADRDPVPENNTARFLVGVSGPRPILHVTESNASGLARLLKGGGLDVRTTRPESFRWSLENLQRFSGVVLENVPAEKIGNDGMETLAAYVRETGAGLLMTGGRSSYGPGGYYKSPLEPILPVSMELRNEHRKLSLAIVVAMDRSGSMSVPVAGGGGKKKMDLANQGAAQVLELLGPMDEFACLAVDTEVHTIAPLKQVQDAAKPAIRKDILSVQSMGGGIFVYEALSAASQILLKAKSGTKHILLFSDAADSEEPGNYQALLEQCEKAGITVSVIGLGTERDVDAELLKDIARRGKGRIFFSDKPEELPRLFAQDTFVVARNTFLDDPVGIRTTPGLTTLIDQPLQSPPGLSVGGYNLCYLRPGATLATVSLDEYKAPIAAAWRAGAGRVVTYTGEADGKYAGGMAKWSKVGDYFTSLARWTAGAGNPLRDNMLMTQELREGVCQIQLHLDPERKGDSFASLPKVATLRSVPGGPPRTENSEMRWSGADTLSVDVRLDGSETVLTSVDVPGHGVVPLPPVCLPYSPEFKPAQDDRGTVTLERLARGSGGRERIDLAGIWHDLPRHVRLIPIARWLLLAAVGLWLAEVFERRTSLLTAFRRRRPARLSEPAEVAEKPRALPAAAAKKAAAQRTGVKAAPAAAPEAAPRPQAPAAPAAAPAPAPAAKSEGGGMSEALRKARQRARGRTE